MAEPRFKKEEIQAAIEITHREYFMQIISLLSHDTEQDELSYVKVPITTPDGGIYLVSILHVEGPKVSLKNLAEAAEAAETSEPEKA